MAIWIFVLNQNKFLEISLNILKISSDKIGNVVYDNNRKIIMDMEKLT